MPKLSKKVINEVKSIAPMVREELTTEFQVWERHYNVCPEFYSDDALLSELPYAAYEYIILAWNLEPARLSPDAAVSALNGKVFEDIRKITAHALRRLAAVNTTK